MKQYFFNAHLFPASFDTCPPILCFPTFLSLSLITLINNTARIQSKRYKAAKDTIHEGFFHMLPTLVHCLYRYTDPNVPLPRLKPITMPPASVENFNLEFFMEDEEDRVRYRQMLHRVNLRWNGVATTRDLLSHLVSTKVCPLLDDDDDNIPESLQYTPVNTKREEDPDKKGPALWGPYFWKIFHFVGALQNNDDDVLYMQDVFPSLINSLIPCVICEINYNTYIKPSQFPNAIKNHKEVYKRIHARVTEHVLNN